MALISDLVTELSVMSGIPEPSIAVVARRLREDGLLSQKGRGRGAAQATPLDAARLCIALMIGGKAKDASIVVADFGGLRLSQPTSSPDIATQGSPSRQQLAWRRITASRRLSPP